MKKLLGIVVLSLFWSVNAFAHIENKFVYLVCDSAAYNERYIVTIDIKKKTVESYKPSTKKTTEYNIYKTTETWIKAKAIDNENERIIIHRYVNEAFFQEFKDNKWNDTSDPHLYCEKKKKNF